MTYPFGLAERLGRILPTTKEALEYWVDATDGNDANDGSEAHPFKTIAHTVNKVPKILLHDVTIWLVSDTWNEPIFLDGFICFNGKFNIRGITATATNHQVTYVKLTDCFGNFKIQYIEATTTSEDAFVATQCFGFIYCNYCVATGADAGHYGLVAYIGYICATSGTFSNKKAGIAASAQGSIRSRDNGGVNNTNGLYAETCGHICKDGTTQPGGTTAESTATGGRITPYSDSGSSTGTGAQQTIAHELGRTPKGVVLTPTAAAGDPYLSAASDATNIYPFVANGVTYNWAVFG